VGPHGEIPGVETNRQAEHLGHEQDDQGTAT